MFLRSTLAILFMSIFAFGGGPRSKFQAKTDDLTVEDKCETYKPRFFTAEPIRYFTVSTEGSTRVGFSEEVPITRSQVKTLWAAVHPKSSQAKVNKALKTINKSEKLKFDLELLKLGKVERAATYHSEGEILEILSYVYLTDSNSFLQMISQHFESRDFSEEDFFITGGVRYFDTRSGRTIGELDVVVGDSQTCTIFGIGEAKLGGKRNKARRQLNRIKDFIRRL